MKSINYKEKNYDTIFKEMITSSYDKGLLSDDEYFIDHINNLQDIENNYVMLESVYAYENSQIYKDMTKIYESWDIDKATGNELDIIGAKLGIPRPQATNAITTLTFTRTNNATGDITIPSGTIVKTITGIQYTTTETVILRNNVMSIDVKARSVSKGISGRVGKHTLKIIESSLSDLDVTNLKGSGGGRKEYTDKEYRNLLKAWAYSHIKGTKEAYELYFSYKEGVDGYKLIPLWDGAGTVKCVIDPPNSFLEDEILTELKKRVQLFDDDVLVIGAKEITVDVDVDVNVNIDEVVEYSLPEMEEIALKVEDAIATYIDGGYYTTKKGAKKYYNGMQIGQDFIPHKCSVFVDNQIPELKTITFNGVNKGKRHNIKATDFTNYNHVAYEIGMERLIGDKGGSCVYNTALNMTEPYMLESDSSNFSFIIKNKNGEIIKQSSDMQFSLEGLNFEDATLELKAKEDGAKLSYINIIPKDKVGNITGSFITVNDDEVCVSGSINVNVE